MLGSRGRPSTAPTPRPLRMSICQPQRSQPLLPARTSQPGQAWMDLVLGWAPLCRAACHMRQAATAACAPREPRYKRRRAARYSAALKNFIFDQKIKIKKKGGLSTKHKHKPWHRYAHCLKIQCLPAENFPKPFSAYTLIHLFPKKLLSLLQKCQLSFARPNSKGFGA